MCTETLITEWGVAPERWFIMTKDIHGEKFEAWRSPLGSAYITVASYHGNAARREGTFLGSFLHEEAARAFIDAIDDERHHVPGNWERGLSTGAGKERFPVPK